MDAKIDRIIIPHSNKISISERNCNMCKVNCNRAFVLRFRGVVQLEFQICADCLHNKIEIPIRDGKDSLLQFDTFDRGGIVGI